MDARDIRYTIFEAVEATDDETLLITLELPERTDTRQLEAALACFKKAGWVVDWYPNARARTVVVRLDGRERATSVRAYTDEPG